MRSAPPASPARRWRWATAPPAPAACCSTSTASAAITAEGETRGALVLPPRGDSGFGWDPVFQPDGEDRTYGEMSAAEKDRIGHRGRAWRACCPAGSPAPP